MGTCPNGQCYVINETLAIMVKQNAKTESKIL